MHAGAMLQFGPVDDVLSDLLNAFQMRAHVCAWPKVCGDWRFGTSGTGCASFHVVADAECWLHTRILPEPLRLAAGDFVMLPSDDWHPLSGSRVLDGLDARMVTDGDGPHSILICGRIDLLAGRVNPLLAALPRILHVPASDQTALLTATASRFRDELEMRAIGTRAVIDRLADVLFVMALRHHFTSTREPHGLVAALIDPRVRMTLDAIHRNPEKAWTVELLAELASMSKSAYSTHFSGLVGMPPKEYVAHWRMTRAELLLRDPGTTVADAAAKSGYQSEATFRRAFKRLFGTGPRASRTTRPSSQCARMTGSAPSTSAWQC